MAHITPVTTSMNEPAIVWDKTSNQGVFTTSMTNHDQPQNTNVSPQLRWLGKCQTHPGKTVKFSPLASSQLVWFHRLEHWGWWSRMTIHSTSSSKTKLWNVNRKQLSIYIYLYIHITYVYNISTFTSMCPMGPKTLKCLLRRNSPMGRWGGLRRIIVSMAA